MLYHTEFAFTGEEDPKRLELLLDRFRYPFSIEREDALWYANRAYLPLQELLRAAAGFGHVSASADTDGVFRQVPLVIRVKDHLIPHLAFVAVLNYLQVKAGNVIIGPENMFYCKMRVFPTQRRQKIFVSLLMND